MENLPESSLYKEKNNPNVQKVNTLLHNRSNYIPISKTRVAYELRIHLRRGRDSAMHTRRPLIQLNT